MHLQTFGRYEMIRKLSRSMTDVYLARDPERGREVVLKLIEHSRDDLTQVLIEAEKRGAALQKQLHRLDRRILEVYECGEQNGCFFVAMEYFPGQTVAEILKLERRLEPARAARYAAEICNQLRTLHAFVSDIDGRKTAVVHGDIKPSNIQVGTSDELRLIDFGIAKVITFTHNLTHHNLGSPSYCSPERIKDSKVDQFSDLWAVGVSLYEMLAGIPPYQADDTRKLEELIQSKKPARPLPAACPTGLAAIVSKALAPDMVNRYASAAAFEDDLRAFLTSRTTVAERESSQVRTSNPTVVTQPAAATKPAGSQAQPAIKPLRPSQWGNLTIAALAGVLAGLLLFIPIGYYYRFQSAASRLRSVRDYAHSSVEVLNSDWKLYTDLKSHNRFLGQLSPAIQLDGPMRANLVAAADNILDSFRNSSDGELSDFDWKKARLCLNYALQIEGADSKLKGEMVVCNGYLNLLANPKPPKAALSIESFRQAESYLPKWSDPHLGLARVYIYAFHNIGQGLAEFHQAEQLGYRLGPREAVEKADGYLFRAEWALGRARRTPPSDNKERSKWLALAHDDAERARRLYQPIVGFSNVNASLEQLDQNTASQEELRLASMPKTPVRSRAGTKQAANRRWH